MKYKPFKKPMVMFANVGGGHGHVCHPQIVLGKNDDGDLVSVSCTHSKKPEFHSTRLMENNLKKSYMVSDCCYVGKSFLYRYPFDLETYSVSSKDWREARRICLKEKPIRIH